MKKGFTLLEMLVVIGIIAVLVGFGAISYSTVQKKARDAKRQGDLKAAQQNLEQCYSRNSYQYPDITNAGNTISATCPGDASPLFTIVDPLNTGTYKYTISESTPIGSTYTITAPDLESSTLPFSVSNQQ